MKKVSKRLRRVLDRLATFPPGYLKVWLKYHSPSGEPLIPKTFQREPQRYSEYHLAKLLYDIVRRQWDPAKHPRVQAGSPKGGEFRKKDGSDLQAAAQAPQPARAPEKLAPLPRLIPDSGVSASRRDSLWTGTGVFWDVDGRPWELSEQDVRDWNTITSRGWWTEGANAILPTIWTSIPEFEAEIKRQARSYRDRILLQEGAPNPSDVFNRRGERSRESALAKAEELYTTADNATALFGLAKAPVKAVVKRLASSTKQGAASVAQEIGNRSLKDRIASDRWQSLRSSSAQTPPSTKPSVDFRGYQGVLGEEQNRELKMIFDQMLKNKELDVLPNRSILIHPAGPAEHHLFLQKHRQWFWDRYGIDVDDFVVDVDNVTHDALHAGKKVLNDNTGWWGYDLVNMIHEIEDGIGKLSRDEVLNLAELMLKRRNLDHLPIHPSSKKRP